MLVEVGVGKAWPYTKPKGQKALPFSAPRANIPKASTGLRLSTALYEAFAQTPSGPNAEVGSLTSHNAVGVAVPVWPPIFGLLVTQG